VKRGDIWTVSGGSGYSGKPRPCVIIQDDRFDTDSVTTCAFTTDLTEAAVLRISVAPSQGNGLKRPSKLMVDKIATVPRTKLGERVGTLANSDMVRLNQAILVFLALVK
jgi:mRNA interferase MazF